MKHRSNPFLARLVLVGASLALGSTAHAVNYWFDNNGTSAAFGVVNGGSYDWTAGTPWTTTSTGAFTVAGIAWPGGSNLAGFVGAGAGTSYTMTLGASDSSTVTLQNLILNSDGTNATAIGSGDAVIGGVSSTGTLFLNAANSIGTAAGTLTINSKYDLGASKNTNFRGGTVIINGVISGTGTSGVILASGAFGLTAGTLTLAGDNTFAGNTSVASGYTLRVQHANALGAVGGTNTVSSGGTLELASGIVSNSGESISINGDGGSSIGALRAGTGGGTWVGGVTLATSARLGATAGNTLTVTGSIGGVAGSALGISGQSGTGVVILNPTASNTYAGATNIIRGILRIGKTDALPTGTTLDVDSANTVTDAATFDLASFNQTVAVLQDTATTNINGKITNSVSSTISTLTVNQASNTDFGGIIENGNGSTVLTKGGAGNLTLSGPNTFTGGTNIKNGSIIISAFDDRLATGGSVVLGDVATTGKLVLGTATTARNQTLAGLTTTGSGGSVVGAHATTNSVLTLSFASGTNTFGGTLGGAGTNENKLALTKTGAGTLKLTGANSYSGPTILTQGTLQIGVDPIGAITSSAIGTGTLTFNGGTLSSDGGTGRTIGNAVTFTGNAGLGDATNNGKLTFTNNMDLGATARTITVNSDVQLDGAFSNPGTAPTNAVTKAGAGTLTINASNAGVNFGNGNPSGFVISAGKVIASNVAAFGNAGQIVTLNGGTGTTAGSTVEFATDASPNAFVLNQNSNHNGTVILNRATSGTAIAYSMGSATLGAGNLLNVQKGGNVTDTPTLALAGLALTAGGAGTTTLSPTTANISIAGSVSGAGTANAKTLQLDGTSTGNLVSGIISNGTANPLSLTKANSGTWELSNANTFTGKTQVTGGTLKLSDNLAIQSSAFDPSGAGSLDITTINTPTFGGLTSATSYVLPVNVTGLTLNPGSGTQTYTGNLSGGVSGLTLTKTGAGTQVLSGTNSYSGLTTVNGGELRVTNATAIGGTHVEVLSGRLALDGGITVSGKSLTTSGSGSNFFGGLQSVSGTNTWDGSVLLGLDLSRLGARKNATLVISGAIDDGANTFTAVIRNENQNNTSGAGNATTITELSGVSTYGGNTQLIAGVTRLGGGDNRLPTATVLQFGGSGANAKFDMNGRNQEVAGLAVMSANNDTQRDWNANELTNSSGTLSTLTVNTAADQTFGLTPTNFGGRENYTGIITGNTALVKDGAAKLTLSGTNTYTGATTVSAGTLAINGSISTSTTTVHDTGTLGGTGTTGAVSVANGGTLAPGNSAGTLSVNGDLGLSDASILAFELDPGDTAIGGGVNDLVSVAGALTLDGLLKVTATSGTFTGVTSGSWRLFNYGSLAANNTLAWDTMPSLDTGYSWSVDTAISGQVNLTIIPEPNAALLGGLGVLALLRRRRSA